MVMGFPRAALQATESDRWGSDALGSSVVRMARIPDLTRRRREPELMDDPGLDPALHVHALRGLAAVNRVSRAAEGLFAELRPRFDGRPVRVLDVACGGGDVAVALEGLCRRRGIDLTADGLDRSEVAVGRARDRASKAGAHGRFFAGDALGGRLPDGYDFLVTSLFLHHLDEQAVVRLLAAMRRAARVGLVACDLERTLPGLVAAAAGTRLLTRSRIVHVDGVLSVRAAFRVRELRRLAEEAGLRGARIRRSWPFRLALSWWRS